MIPAIHRELSRQKRSNETHESKTWSRNASALVRSMTSVP